MSSRRQLEHCPHSRVLKYSKYTGAALDVLLGTEAGSKELAQHLGIEGTALVSRSPPLQTVTVSLFCVCSAASWRVQNCAISIVVLAAKGPKINAGAPNSKRPPMIEMNAGIVCAPQTVSDEHWSKDTVDSANNSSSPRGEDQRTHPASVQQEGDRRRYPDGEGTKYWHDRQEPHDQLPKQRSRQSKRAEHQATQRSLNCGDSKGSINRCMICFSDTLKQLFGLGFGQRQPTRDDVSCSQPVA